MDPDLRTFIFGTLAQPFSITLSFPRFEGPAYERALTLARQARSYRESGSGDQIRSFARFQPEDIRGAARRSTSWWARSKAPRCWSTSGPGHSRASCGCRLFWYLLPR